MFYNVKSAKEITPHNPIEDTQRGTLKLESWNCNKGDIEIHFLE